MVTLSRSDVLQAVSDLLVKQDCISITELWTPQQKKSVLYCGLKGILNLKDYFNCEIVIKALVNLDGNLGAHVRSNIMSLDLFKAFD